MQITSTEWLDYVTRLSQINQKASDLLNEYIQLHGTEDMYPIIEYAYSLVNRYGGASSELACQMYDQLAKLQNADVLGAVPSDLPEMSDVARAINGTKDKLNGPADAIGRLVKKSASDTMLQNAKRDGAEYAWINHGDSCVYCKYLSSFGWLHANLNNGNRYLGHIHNNCDCEFAIRFDGKSTVEGYDPDKLQQEIENADGDTIDEKINSMRREQYKVNGDKIRAQKRSVYAKKKNVYGDDKLLRITQIPASTITEKVKSGEYSLKLSQQQYDKHLYGTRDYQRYMKQRELKGLNPQSRLIISKEEAQGIIENQSGTGIIRVRKDGSASNIEQITCDKIIGKYCQKGKWFPTRKAAIHHGKKGSHLVPIKGSHYD